MTILTQIRQKQIALSRLKALANLWEVELTDLAGDHSTNASHRVTHETDRGHWHVIIYSAEDPVQVRISSSAHNWWIDAAIDDQLLHLFPRKGLLRYKSPFFTFGVEMNSKEIVNALQNGKRFEDLAEALAADAQALATLRRAVQPEAVKAAYLEVDGRWRAACRKCPSENPEALLSFFKTSPRSAILFKEKPSHIPAFRPVVPTYADVTTKLSDAFLEHFEIALAETNKLLSSEYSVEQREHEAAKVIIELWIDKIKSKIPAAEIFRAVMDATRRAQERDARFRFDASDTLTLTNPILLSEIAGKLVP